MVAETFAAVNRRPKISTKILQRYRGREVSSWAGPLRISSASVIVNSGNEVLTNDLSRCFRRTLLHVDVEVLCRVLVAAKYQSLGSLRARFPLQHGREGRRETRKVKSTKPIKQHTEDFLPSR